MKLRNNRGFSLVELLTILGIIGIVTAIAIPNMISWRAGHKLRGVANNFMTDLQMARLRAIRESAQVAVVINANGYTIFVDDGAGGGTANDYTLDPGEAQLRNVTLPPGVTISLNNFTAGRTAFNSRGMPLNLGTLRFQNSAGDTRGVVINRVGRIRLE